MDFTVEVTTRPVIDSDWSVQRNVLDAVPGTVLVEDPEAPVLFIPVEANEPMRAAKFVEGLAILTGLKIESGKIYPTENDPDLDDLFDCDDDDVEVERTEVVRALDDYAAQTPQLAGYVSSDGRLINS